MATLRRKEIRLYPWIFCMKEGELDTGSGLSLCENPEVGIVLGSKLYFLSFETISVFVCFSFSFALPLQHTQIHPPLFSVLFSGRLILQIITQAPLVSGFRFGFDYGEAAA